MNTDTQQKKTWTELVTLTEPGSDLAVRVQKSNDERPILSWQTGRLHDNRFMPHHRNRYNTTEGWVSIEKIDTALLVRLIEKAQEYIENAHQERENAFQARRRNSRSRA